jgi:hypothetical protein
MIEIKLSKVGVLSIVISPETVLVLSLSRSKSVMFTIPDTLRLP